MFVVFWLRRGNFEMGDYKEEKWGEGGEEGRREKGMKGRKREHTTRTGTCTGCSTVGALALAAGG